MNSEVKEKLEVDKNHNADDRSTTMTRIMLDDDVHSRIVTHQAILTGRKKSFVTFPEACYDLLRKATRRIKPQPNVNN